MPIIAANIALSVFEEIRDLVEKGLYASPEQFLEIAAFNQVALERGATPQELMARGPRQVNADSGERPLHESGRASPEARREGKKPRRQRPVPNRVPETRSISEESVVEAKARLSLSQKGTIPTPVSPTKRPPDERIWGQVNRLFPIKLACRWIAFANSGIPQWRKYGTLSDQLAADAATIGSVLEKLDVAAQRKRDDLLATGLPRVGNLHSSDRFLSQIIARVTRASEIYPGAICQYALAVFDGEQLALTNAGIELSKLHNPILDADATFATTTLSDLERKFFLRQVVQFVPGEYRDLRVIAKAIAAGESAPESLTKAVREEFPEEWGGAVVRTHVSGVIARLIEIGLIRRQWEGRNVVYMNTAAAMPLLDSPIEGTP